MLSFLKNHPFAIEAFFESSIVITFAAPKEHIQNLIPPCVELDTFNDKWGFLAIAMVQTRNLRPKYFPKLFGNDFFLIGYRVFVKYVNRSGKRLRGLYILKSETDKKKMELLGNIFTHYNYSTTDIKREIKNDSLLISSINSDFNVLIETEKEITTLPNGSPFINWNEARRFRPLPYTFTYNKKSKMY